MGKLQSDGQDGDEDPPVKMGKQPLGSSRSIAPADATSVAAKEPLTIDRLRNSIEDDRAERDSLTKAAATPDSVQGHPTVLPYQNAKSRLKRAGQAQDRMNARADSLSSARKASDKVRQELFDVEDNVDDMKKNATSGLHRARLDPSVDNDFEGDADIERDFKRRSEARQSTKKKGT